MKKITAVLATLTLTSLISPAGAQLVGELGVLDVENANGGINPQTGVAWVAGDTYRLALHTEDKRDTLSTDIADYNAFVNTVADGSVAFPSLGDGDWKVLGSTETVSARENTNSSDLTPGVGAPVFVLDGVTMIAEDNADMWNGWSNGGTNIRIPNADNNAAVRYSPYLNEEGTGDTGVVHGVSVATGSNSDGSIGGEPFGNVGDRNRLNWGSSNGNRVGRIWARFGNGNPSNNWSFYALSEPLTIITDGAFQAFAITEIDYSEDDNMLTLTWTSIPGESYAVKFSGDMTNWDSDLDDGIPASEGGTTTTETFDLTDSGLIGEERVYFRVEIQP